MLYKKNSEQKLSEALFKNPTSEYRGTPFWAWNGKLQKEELVRQIEDFKSMGFGGFHMHVRTGLETEYLSNEYMGLVSACTEKARSEEMLAWLYDEDRWPSGAAGGKVTRDERFRQRYLIFTPVPNEELGKPKLNKVRSEGERNGSGRFLAAYDVRLNADGTLAGFRRIGEDEPAENDKWYAYLEICAPSSWYNNETYVDTLSKSAIDKFIEITHETYKKTVGAEFDKTVPAIFTDEPQFAGKGCLGNSFDKTDVMLPWTDDFADTFRAAYGCDILDSMPELFWELPDGGVSVARYHFHDHVCERFTEAFADNIGKWCSDNHIALTGHMMDEPSLRSQTGKLGEAMRSYRGFGIPGIDMLCNSHEFTTAKQCQSAVRQFGREAMLCEIYGVTGWDFDFRGHKLHGDWQAAMGVTVRVPHLAWYTMKGEAKRDYPAAISYQSPWYKKYSDVEDHFARVNTAMTRGKPLVKIGVIHPVESYWLHWGPKDMTDLKRESMDNRFKELTDWLVNGSADFDFISESLLPGLCDSGGSPLKVGSMSYDVVIVPGCETLRSTTLERLEAFRDAGGKLIFIGGAPTLENAVKSDRGERLCERAALIAHDKAALFAELDPYRTVFIRYWDGRMCGNLTYQLRQDNDCEWLFIAKTCEPYNKDHFRRDDIKISVRGEYSVEIYDTLTGDIAPAPVEYRGGFTVIPRSFYDYDSLLLKLVPGRSECLFVDSGCAPVITGTVQRLPDFVKYSLDEPNVLLLDMARFAVDGGELSADSEEILRLDNIARARIGLPGREGGIAQPYTVTAEPPKHSVTLRFEINSLVELPYAELALEDADKAVVVWNGKNVPAVDIGWYVDRSIRRIALPGIIRGSNELTVTWPLGARANTEWCYLLGDFGVRVSGRNAMLIPRSPVIAFGDITNQGLPFYGGNITYELDLNVNGFAGEEKTVGVCLPRYRGAVAEVLLDGESKGDIIFSPNRLYINGVTPGAHKLELRLYTHRFNSFGAVHNADLARSWHGPDAWRTKNEDWSYEYNLKQIGLISAPVVTVQ